MTERSHVYNGRFLQNLDLWTATNASYSAGDGDDHYGVAALSVGGYIVQDFTVPLARSYSLHVAVKPVGAVLTTNQVQAIITDDKGNQLPAISLEGDTNGAWQENTDTLGLAPGTTYRLQILNGAAVPVRIDDVWLWFVPITRAQIATQVHARLGTLATDYSLSTTQSGALTEGSYTYAIDSGLRGCNAVNDETGQPDVRYLDAGDVLTVLDLVEGEMLKRVQRSAAVEVDVSLGPRRESLSQKAKNIGEMIAGGAASGGGRVVLRRLRHEATDYELGGGW